MYKLHTILLTACFFILSSAWCQHRERFAGVALTNHHSAYPFSTFANLFTKEFHPGIEAAYGFNWKTKPRHDWYQAFKAGYFYHRFVQHAIPIYTQFGYRYKPSQHFHFTTALGAGYQHSVPATAVLQLNDDGTYKKAKGIGRGQALLNFAVGLQYNLNKAAVFMDYRQEIQLPFIRSYVPLLPYNSIALGVSVPLKNKH